MGLRVNAVVLAGRDNTARLAECSDAPNEALIEINDKPMVQFVLDALSGSRYVDKIALVGPGELMRSRVGADKVTYVERGLSLFENVRNGAASLPPAQKILVVTSDIPMITAEIVDGFLELCTEREADLYFPVVTREDTESKYPLVRRTYVKLLEGLFTAGNMALLEPYVIDRCAGLAERFIEARKKPWKLASIVGFTFLLKFLFHRLSLAEVERRMSALLGIRGAAIRCPWPEVGIDVDKPTDLRLVKAALAR